METLGGAQRKTLAAGAVGRANMADPQLAVVVSIILLL